MDIVFFLIDLVLHIDRQLLAFVNDHGAWAYGLLFLIVFTETGLVVMPFLPGDSLLFVVGALASSGAISLPIAIGVLLFAAIAGDQVNYSIGRRVGPRVFGWEKSRLFNRQAFDHAHAFYERHGGITIIAARFMPFVRTFAPFVAGVSEMNRRRFTAYNVAGAVLWIVSLTLAGYLFGNIPFVKDNLTKFIWALILIPGAFALLAAWKSSKFKNVQAKAKATATATATATEKEKVSRDTNGS